MPKGMWAVREWMEYQHPKLSQNLKLQLYSFLPNQWMHMNYEANELHRCASCKPVSVTEGWNGVKDDSQENMEEKKADTDIQVYYFL